MAPQWPQVTVSRGPAGPEAARRCPCVCPGLTGALLRVRGREGGPLVTMSTSGLVCEAEAGQPGPRPSPKPQHGRPGCAQCPQPAGPREPVVSWAQLQGLRLACGLEAEPALQEPVARSMTGRPAWAGVPAGPHSGAPPAGSPEEAGVERGTGGRQGAWEERLPGQATGKLHLAAVLCAQPHPTAWTDR